VRVTAVTPRNRRGGRVLLRDEGPVPRPLEEHMNKTTTLITAALAIALGACGQKAKTDPYLANVPDVAALTMDTSAAAPAGVVSLEPAGVASLQNDLAVVHEKAEAMNHAVRDVFAHLEAITSTGGHELVGNVKEWGPVDRCVEPDGTGGCVLGGVANLRLFVKLFGDRASAFRVDARPQGSTNPDDFQPVLAGYLMRGAVERRGAGKLWVDFPNLQAAAHGFRGEGYLAAGFAAGPIAKEVTYRMLGFTRDAALYPKVIAASFTAWKNAAGWVRARVAGIKDLDQTTTAPELGIWRAVWAPGFGGRAFTVISDFWDPQTQTTVGDVPTDKYWFARACYPPGQSVPSYKEWFLCDRGVHPEMMMGVTVMVPNHPAYCVLQNGGVGAPDTSVVTPSSPQTWQATTCYWDPAMHAMADEPEEIRAPGIEPRDADDGRDEDGASHVGLLPEPCPATANSPPDTAPPGMGP
jgi:hypothetical protein